MREFMEITRALADENRVRALLALQERELCACQIIEFLGLAPSTVSKHLSILKQARLVETRKDGRWIYYRLADDDSSSQVKEALAWVCGSLNREPGIGKEMEKLRKILNTDREIICRNQTKN